MNDQLPAGRVERLSFGICLHLIDFDNLAPALNAKVYQRTIDDGLVLPLVDVAFFVKRIDNVTMIADVVRDSPFVSLFAAREFRAVSFELLDLPPEIWGVQIACCHQVFKFGHLPNKARNPLDNLVLFNCPNHDSESLVSVPL